jgi:hypothetical protein
MSRANRFLAIASATLVALAVVGALVSANRPGAMFDPAGPEAAVRAYVNAALDGRSDAAARFLATGGPCDAVDLATARVVERPDRIVLVDSSTEGDTATVVVEIAYPSGSGPLDPAEYTERHTYELTSASGAWRLTGVPWPLWECGGE